MEEKSNELFNFSLLRLMTAIALGSIPFAIINYVVESYGVGDPEFRSIYGPRAQVAASFVSIAIVAIVLIVKRHQYRLLIRHFWFVFFGCFLTVPLASVVSSLDNRGDVVYLMIVLILAPLCLLISILTAKRNQKLNDRNRFF